MEVLAATAIATVAPYLAMGAEEFAKEAGKEAAGAIKLLVEKLSSWWSGNAVAKAGAENLPSNPELYSKLLSDLLSKELQGNEPLANDIKRLLREAEPHVEVVQRMKVGERVTGADIMKIASGSLHVTQEIDSAKDVVGVRADQLGVTFSRQESD
jgi:hypothetical protein